MPFLKMGQPEQGFNEQTDPAIMLLQGLVISLHLMNEAPKIPLGILLGGTFRFSHQADALQIFQSLDFFPQMLQVEGEADVGDDDVVFDIRHQAVDEADVLDILPGDDLDVQIVAQPVGVLLKEKLVFPGDPVPGKELQQTDDSILGVKGELAHQDLVAPDGDGPGIGFAVGLALQPDMGRRRGLFRVNPPQAVAYQFQLALDADQIEAAVQVEKFFDDPYRDPVEVVQGLIFLGQVVEGHEGVVLQGAKVILPEFPPLFRHPGGNLCQVYGDVHIDLLFQTGNCPTSAAGSQLFGGGAAPVPGHPDFEEIPALAIVDDDGGQVLHL